ncbi:MAG: hypothetical protein VCA36_03915, partial [Opitutales bacterium]
MNTRMKLGASLAAILTVTNLSAVEIGPTGSGIELSGFADLKYVHENAADSFDTSQVELDLDFDSGLVSFSLDVDFTSSGTTLEEAVVTYDAGDGLSVSAGRQLSFVGFEAYDPINMYQISYAYDHTGGDQDIYDAYRDGVSASYVTDKFSISAFAQYVEDDNTSITNAEKTGYEYVFAYTGIDKLVVKAIFADAPTYDVDNYWASYQVSDDLMVAAEYAEKDNDTGDDIEGWLLMGDYSVNEKLGLVLRYSEEEIGAVDYDKFTIAPNYAISDE